MDETPFLLNNIYIIIKITGDKLSIEGQQLSHHDSLCIGHRMHY